MTRRVVWQIDATPLTPYYNAALCRALANADCAVRLFSAPYLYDAAVRPPQDYEVDLFYGGWLRHRRWLSYPRLRRRLRGLFHLAGHRRLIRLLDASPPDVVHIQWSRVPRLDRWLVQQIRQRGIPVVHTVHDIEPLFDISADLLSQVYLLADRLVLHAGANCGTLRRMYPQLGSERVRVIPHIATAWDTPPDADRGFARRVLGLPPDAPVLLFFGTVRPYKGLDVLLDAFARARRVFPNLWLVVAGLQDKTPRRVHSGDQLRVHDMFVPSDWVWLYHLAADAAVFPYHRVSQSGALITAMQFGLPVIATNTGGLPETIDGNGWIVPPSDSRQLAEAIASAVSDGERLRRMGARSLELIAERHAPRAIARQTIALYDEVIRSCGVSSTSPTV